MHSRWVLDTSVVIKWFRQGEVLADRALDIRAAYLDGRALVFVPTLLAYELINLLRYKSDLTTEQVAQAAQSLLEMGLDWVMPAAPWLRRAAVIARDYDVTVYDAAFAALAETLDATLITADAQLATRMSASARVRFLGDWESSP